MELGAPLIVTSSTLTEQCIDLDLLTSAPGCRVLLPPTVNPFCSRRVLQSGTLANDVYYKNMFLAVLVCD